MSSRECTGERENLWVGHGEQVQAVPVPVASYLGSGPTSVPVQQMTH
jgi:hypothetical protein